MVSETLPDMKLHSFGNYFFLSLLYARNHSDSGILVLNIPSSLHAGYGNSMSIVKFIHSIKSLFLAMR